MRESCPQPCVSGFTRRRPPGRVAGFTVVELLVVVGIIGMLVAVLLPVVMRVRLQARRTTDLNNIRQLAVACVAYAAESHGDWPLGSRLGTDVTTPTDNDDVEWTDTWSFAYFLGFTTTRQAAEDWLSAPFDPAARMAEPLRRRLACTSMVDAPDNGMYACVGLPLFRYDPYSQGVFASFMGYAYWGRRPPRVTGQVFDDHGNVYGPASQFAFPLKQGGRSSFDVLLTCDAFAAPVAQELPHCGNSDMYQVYYLPCTTPGDGRSGPTVAMNGLCSAYTDGSARWTPRRDLWSVTSGAGYWYFLDGSRRQR